MIITIFVKTQYIEYVFTFNSSLNTLYSSNTRCSSYFAELRHDLYVIRNRMTFTYYHYKFEFKQWFSFRNEISFNLGILRHFDILQMFMHYQLVSNNKDDSQVIKQDMNTNRNHS